MFISFFVRNHFCIINIFVFQCCWGLQICTKRFFLYVYAVLLFKCFDLECVCTFMYVCYIVQFLSWCHWQNLGHLYFLPTPPVQKPLNHSEEGGKNIKNMGKMREWKRDPRVRTNPLDVSSIFCCSDSCGSHCDKKRYGQRAKHLYQLNQSGLLSKFPNTATSPKYRLL